MQEKQFIDKGAKRVRLHEFLEEELEGAGYSHSDLVRTPTSTKIMVYAQRPGLVIGRGGARIQELTEKMEKVFDYENPQIEVNEIENGDANAEIVAKSMASWLEKGGSAKRVGYTYLRRMKEAGVIGAEIEIAGKLSGNRGRTEKFSYGYVKRCGNTSRENVDQAYRLAKTKPGAIGVKVRIMKDLPDFKHRDVDVEDEILHEVIEQEEEDSETEAEKVEKIVRNADNMTAAAIEEAAEEAGVEMEDVSIGEVRDAFEDFEPAEEEKEEASEDTEEEAEEDEAEEEVEETSEDEDKSDETEDSADYEEIVSGTISDAKDALDDLENPDFDEALEAEKAGKNRTTFIDWLETRVDA